MEKNLAFLENMAQCFGVTMRVFSEPLPDLENYDGGLRSCLFQNHDTGPLAKFLRSMDNAVLYILEDTYSCHYCCLKHGGGGG
jgi:hypothetical protein